MKKKLAAVLFCALTLITGEVLLTESAYATNSAKIAYASALKNEDGEFDNRVEKLATFFNNQNSPLAPYAQHFIEAADAYELDWKLVPAITGVESSFGKRMPYLSYNAYGWNNGVYKFDSWEDSIWHVNKTLKEKYVNRGAGDVYKIGRIYAPPSTTWSKKVAYFMDKIEKTPTANLDL